MKYTARAWKQAQKRMQASSLNSRSYIRKIQIYQDGLPSKGLGLIIQLCRLSLKAVIFIWTMTTMVKKISMGPFSWIPATISRSRMIT